MCFSQYAQYMPRPEVMHTPVRPEGAPPTSADLDTNLFGPKPLPPEWQEESAPDNGHSHVETATQAPAATVYAAAPASNNGANAIAAVKTQTVEAVVVELANGTKLLICPL